MTLLQACRLNDLSTLLWIRLSVVSPSAPLLLHFLTAHRCHSSNVSAIPRAVGFSHRDQGVDLSCSWCSDVGSRTASFPYTLFLPMSAELTVHNVIVSRFAHDVLVLQASSHLRLWIPQRPMDLHCIPPPLHITIWEAAGSSYRILGWFVWCVWSKSRLAEEGYGVVSRSSRLSAIDRPPTL